MWYDKIKLGLVVATEVDKKLFIGSDIIQKENYRINALNRD